MSFNGTEGKWTVIDGKTAGKQVVSKSAPKARMNVASCGGQRREENANLIAAAPELLEALQDVIHAHDKHGEHSEWDFARTAIAKALGQ
ncbi:TPA: hypothetical protein NV922_001317 [Escherichia coli]|nr:hypothetical protein [Escherichia coli]